MNSNRFSDSADLNVDAAETAEPEGGGQERMRRR